MSVIVGLGSPHGDDQLGWVAIDRLRPLLPDGFSTHKVRGGLELLDCLMKHDAAIVVDAAAPAGRPGSIRSFTWPCTELENRVSSSTSTHGVGLIEALRLAETLGHLPRHVIIHTIEARDMSPGASLGDDTARQLNVLVESIIADLAANGRVG